MERFSNWEVRVQENILHEEEETGACQWSENNRKLVIVVLPADLATWSPVAAVALALGQSIRRQLR